MLHLRIGKLNSELRIGPALTIMQWLNTLKDTQPLSFITTILTMNIFMMRIGASFYQKFDCPVCDASSLGILNCKMQWSKTISI